MNPFYIKNKFNIPLISPLSNSLVCKRVDARTHIYIYILYVYCSRCISTSATVGSDWVA